MQQKNFLKNLLAERVSATFVGFRNSSACGGHRFEIGW